MSDPILAEKSLETSDRYIKVRGGLHYIKGNKKPYFAITADMFRSGGCQHDAIKQYYGDHFNDLIDFHLADIDGVPMHAVENGWYFLEKGDRENVQKHFRLTDGGTDTMMKEIDSKDKLALWVECMKPFWKDYAKIIIKKYNLTIYGDRYEEAV